jgi:hypothetical protein
MAGGLLGFVTDIRTLLKKHLNHLDVAVLRSPMQRSGIVPNAEVRSKCAVQDGSKPDCALQQPRGQRTRQLHSQNNVRVVAASMRFPRRFLARQAAALLVWAVHRRPIQPTLGCTCWKSHWLIQPGAAMQ